MNPDPKACLAPHVADGGRAHHEKKDNENGPADEVGHQVDGNSAVVVPDLERVGLVETDTAGLLRARHCQRSLGERCSLNNQC